MDNGYFEIRIEEATRTIDKNQLCVAVGLCGEFAKLPMRLPGWRHFTYGCHGDNGQYYQEQGNVDGDQVSVTFGNTGDVIGCHVDWREGFIEFFINGKWSGEYLPSTS